MKLACPECGHRQDAGERCATCSYDGMLDLANEQHVELLRDIDHRRRDKHSDRTRLLAVGISLAVVFGLWLVPGYWSWRGVAYPGLPFFADQWFFMIVIALGVWKLLGRTAPKPRFPYLDGG